MLTAHGVPVSIQYPLVPVHLVHVVHGQGYAELRSYKADRQPGKDESVNPTRKRRCKLHVPSDSRASRASTPLVLVLHPYSPSVALVMTQDAVEWRRAS
jgi:hypothetical protein